MFEKKKSNLLFSFFIIIVIAMLTVMAFQLPMKSGTIPRYVGFAIIILCLMDVMLTLKKKESSTEKRKNDIKRAWDKTTLWKMLVLSAAFVVSLYLMGYIVSVAGFTYLSMRFLGVKKVTILYGIPVIFSVVLYISFGLLLNVPLPQSIFFM